MRRCYSHTAFPAWKVRCRSYALHPLHRKLRPYTWNTKDQKAWPLLPYQLKFSCTALSPFIRKPRQGSGWKGWFLRGSAQALFCLTGPKKTKEENRERTNDLVGVCTAPLLPPTLASFSLIFAWIDPYVCPL